MARGQSHSTARIFHSRRYMVLWAYRAMFRFIMFLCPERDSIVPTRQNFSVSYCTTLEMNTSRLITHYGFVLSASACHAIFILDLSNFFTLKMHVNVQKI